MNRRRITIAVIAFLLASNIASLLALLHAYKWEQMWLRMELERQAISNGAMWSLSDFRVGNFRLLKLIPVDDGKIEDTGARDGPFEVWTWTYVDGVPGSKEAAEKFVEMYNRKMRIMYADPDDFLEGVTNHPLQTKTKGPGP